jgi:hypothetical protein
VTEGADATGDGLRQVVEKATSGAATSHGFARRFGEAVGTFASQRTPAPVNLAVYLRDVPTTPSPPRALSVSSAV